ncbi:MurR/RpiR family transcriptional regulator [Acidipropionibacterium virtanenii]|uniref:HTH-type transcriptional regulator HexR n=1 Tax=Acidipropionibacterium virtanenii TaxID=2057246 RepID=A0A344UXQ5_9ACTN|nr:MurR/RpiR family transcriptional regulator [Acidipropionibacterium virtanenii]AXE40053.1 hypothetical protein JS278_02919 [Acidipropionibacterium virtanenii]
MTQDLFARIASLDGLTAADRALAGYFESSFPNLAFQNLEAIATGAGVSVASVTRFVRKLGYEDFKGFSTSIRAEVEANFDRPLQRQNQPLPEGPGAELAQHLNAAVAEIGKTLDVTSAAEFDRIADLLADETRPLFLASAATGRALMRYFYLLSKYHRGNVHLLPGADMNPHELVDITSDAVIFATAFDRHPKPVEIALRMGRKRGAATALLTNRATSPLRIYADHVLLVHTDPTPRFKSRGTMLLVLESLLTAMETRAPERTVQRTRSLEDGVDQLGLFISPDR